MSLKSFVSTLFTALFSTECNITSSFRFSQSEMNEIISNAKKSNLPYLQNLSKIRGLSSFDVSFLMSKVDLDENKISLIAQAGKMFDEKEFCAQGQTFSDFIFRVCANINLLDENNLDVFKELVQCKNDLYDFSNAMKNPQRAKNRQANKQMAFAFQNVFAE